MIPFQEHLLPLNASRLEQVFASSARRVQAIPTPIGTVKRPDIAPQPFLPFNAWEYSVDLWKADWPDTTRRVVAGSWYCDHAVKGTRRALVRYCSYVGSTLLAALTPPGKFHLSPSWSAEQREAWLHSLPQLQVWDLKQRGKRGRLLFAGSAIFNSFLDRHWPMQSDARFRLERRASMTIDGTTIAVDVDGLGNQADRVRIRGSNASGMLLGASRYCYLVPSTAADRVITFTFIGQPAHGIRFPVRPGLTIKSVIPDRVFARGHAPRSVFCSGRLNGRYLVPSGAALRIYSRVAIWDSTRAPPARKAIAFLGRGRMGIPPHTAELKVSIPGGRPARAFGQYVRGHLVAADRERWRDTLIAIRAAKRLSDKLQLNSATYRPYRVGSIILMGGSYPLGRWTRS